MSNRQLKTPNLAVVGQSGWCLAYVTDVFGVAPHFPSAINAWHGAIYPHPNEQPPTDVSVPVWFDYNGPYGHVAVSVPGRGIYSTSAQGDKVFGTVQQLVNWMGEGFVYLGWSEDINGVRVVEPAPAVSRSPGDYMQYAPAPYNMTKRVTKSPTSWWNLNNDTANIDNFHPAASLNLHTPFTVGGYAINTHFPQYRYAMTPEDFGRAVNGNYSTNNGVNERDLEDIPPEPVYVPPAAPVIAPLAEKYSLITTVMYFKEAPDAKQRNNPVSTIDKGEYYVVGRDEQAVKLSKDNKSDIGWINTFDNKVETPKPIVVATPAVVTLPVDAPPVHDEMVDASDNSVPVAMAPIADITPTKPKPQYQWINNHAAQTMVSTNSIPITVHDLEGKYPDQQLPPNWRGEFSMYANVKGVTYYLPDKMRKAGWFFGIPETMLKPVQQAKLDLNNDGRVNIADAIGIGGFIMTESKRAYTRLIAPVITDLRTEKAQLAKQRITKAIDGFSAGRKKGK